MDTGLTELASRSNTVHFKVFINCPKDQDTNISVPVTFSPIRQVPLQNGAKYFKVVQARGSALNHSAVGAVLCLNSRLLDRVGGGQKKRREGCDW